MTKHAPATPLPLKLSPRDDITLRYICPRCGRKLSKVAAMESATMNVRRKCGGCGRCYSLTIKPIAIQQGWAHSALICELEQRITVIE